MCGNGRTIRFLLHVCTRGGVPLIYSYDKQHVAADHLQPTSRSLLEPLVVKLAPLVKMVKLGRGSWQLGVVSDDLWM
jgi:hypothetical protein